MDKQLSDANGKNILRLISDSRVIKYLYILPKLSKLFVSEWNELSCCRGEILAVSLV
jgi:hypothetical protein